jgi:large subunit ribosomal protein L28
VARKCKISGKKPLSGHKVSKSNIKTNKWQKPNMQTKRIFDPELGREVRLRLSTSAIRTVSKVGLSAYLRKKGLTLKDVM